MLKGVVSAETRGINIPIKIQHPQVGIIALACNFPCNFSRATRKLLTKLHSLKAPLENNNENQKDPKGLNEPKISQLQNSSI